MHKKYISWLYKKKIHILEISLLYHNNTTTTCNSTGVIYEDGHTWVPLDDACATCSCSRGTKHCEPVLCPPAMCLNPIDVPGECCPFCPRKFIIDLGCVLEGSINEVVLNSFCLKNILTI